MVGGGQHTEEMDDEEPHDSFISINDDGDATVGDATKEGGASKGGGGSKEDGAAKQGKASAEWRFPWNSSSLRAEQSSSAKEERCKKNNEDCCSFTAKKQAGQRTISNSSPCGVSAAKRTISNSPTAKETLKADVTQGR